MNKRIFSKSPREIAEKLIIFSSKPKEQQILCVNELQIDIIALLVRLEECEKQRSYFEESANSLISKLEYVTNEMKKRF